MRNEEFWGAGRTMCARTWLPPCGGAVTASAVTEGAEGLFRRPGGDPLCQQRRVVAKSAQLRFRLAAKTAFAPLLLLFPTNPLRWALLGALKANAV